MKTCKILLTDQTRNIVAYYLLKQWARREKRAQSRREKRDDYRF